jgi:uncharacterized protein YegP (UPF0339 family)
VTDRPEVDAIVAELYRVGLVTIGKDAQGRETWTLTAESHRRKAGERRWRLRAKNGQLLANGGEGFASKGNVLRSIKAVRKAVGKASDPVEVKG